MGSACSNANSASTANSVVPQSNGDVKTGSTGAPTELEGKTAPLAQDEDLIEEALADAEVAKVHPSTEEDLPIQTVEEGETEAYQGQKEPEYELVVDSNNFRLRADPIRLILKYAGVPYTETLIEDNSTEQLPLLKIGGETISQSRAIARFLAHKYGLASEDEEEDAQMDMMMEGLSDLIEVVIPIVKIEDEFEKGDKWREVKEGKLKDFLQEYSQILDKNGTGYFVGHQVSWVDLSVSDFLAVLSENVDSELLSEYAQLQTNIGQIRAIPSIAEYVANREAPL